MYFIMKDFVEDGTVYQRKVGAAVRKFETARKRVRAVRGTVLNENREIVMQAFDENLPRHVDAVRNIGSGEDCFV
jgi:hypothetical protein